MDFIAIHAASRPGRLALVEGERALDWAQYHGQRNSLARALAGLGVDAGDRVALWAPNSIEYLLAGAAAGAVGAMAVPINHRLLADEAAYVLDDSDSVVAFVGDPYLDTAAEVRAGGGARGVRHWVTTGARRVDWAVPLHELAAGHDDDALPPGSGALGVSMAYTAGTTGKPKGATRAGGVDPGIAFGWLSALDLADPDHVHLVAGPLYHSAPGAFALLTALMGGTCVIMGKFDPFEAYRLIDAHRVTTTFMAPILLKRLLAVPEEARKRFDTSSLKALVVGGAPCPNPVKEAAAATLGPVLYEFYGSSELGINTVLRPEDTLRKPGSCGRATDGIEVAALDDAGHRLPAGEVGELHVRRYGGMFDGYHKNPAATAEATRGEWVSVGDIAYLDEEGFVFICDRSRDMVISGGVNIYPAEVEDLLHRHPAIADVAVFGVPDDEWGERVHAAVLRVEGATLDEAEVLTFARRHLADYKAPREVSFHDEFPRDAAGKLVKRILREPHWAGRDTRV